MTTTEPTTGIPLPADAIQRILHITSRVHIYQIPPLASNKGYTATTWTTQPPIFTGRLRILETATSSTHSSPHASSNQSVSVTLLLEDSTTGELFAAAPYTSAAAVQHAVDSARFFAIRVVGDGGRMKATLGLGFEERSDAFDFGIALQDVRKVLGFEEGERGQQGKGRALEKVLAEAEKRDYSLKEGETITVNLGARGRRGRVKQADGDDEPVPEEDQGIYSIKPPPSHEKHLDDPVRLLGPPPSASDAKAQMNSMTMAQHKPTLTAHELGFDDGEFGEFQ